MGMPVQTVASGGLPVVDVSATTPKLGLPVTETTRGVPVTKVTAPKAGLAVTYGTFVEWPPAGAALVPATLDGAATNATLSNGNLTATHSSTANFSGARSASLKTTGKFYFEVTMVARHGQNDAVGVVAGATSYAQLSQGQGGPLVAVNFGGVWVANADTGKNIGVAGGGDVVCAAINLDTGMAWYRKNNGNWNGDAAANPTTGVGGVFSAANASGAPTIGFSGTGTVINDAMTANFGASAFTQAVPSGFTAGWPA